MDVYYIPESRSFRAETPNEYLVEDHTHDELTLWQILKKSGIPQLDKTGQLVKHGNWLAAHRFVFYPADRAGGGFIFFVDVAPNDKKREKQLQRYFNRFNAKYDPLNYDGQYAVYLAKRVPMKCINNKDYEDCMTIGKTYLVEMKDEGRSDSMKRFIADNGETLQTMLDRFEPIES
jgi:hypothetical protein